MATDVAGQSRTNPPRETYTHGHHESVLRSHRWRTAANSAAYLLPHLRPGLDLLDVGCGPGTITVDLARVVAPGRAIGTDRSSEVLVKAGELAAARGVDNVMFEPADAYRLPYAKASFDVVHAHQVLQHLADPVAALREMRRVTRPGGIVAVRDADYRAMSWFPESSGLTAWSRLYQEVAEQNRGRPDAGRRLLAWAHAAGFADVTASASTWCYADDAAREWWAHHWAERITSSAIADQALARGLATRDDLERIAVAWRAWGADDDGWFVVVHGEVLARR
jgi:ubiquinone/menaquinone biosynthesis C-methylase UbiE